MSNSYLILIVDDSFIQRKIFSTTLQAKGYRVILAEDGRQGVDQALQQQPDLILMDLSMPGMDGISAVREIRSHPELSQVPILALTATSDPNELEKAYQAGYTDSINKSERAALIGKIKQWLS